MSVYYICDACGSIVIITDEPISEGQEWACADCGSNAMWEFPNKDAAMHHSRHIQRLARSGIVRRAS